MADVFLLPKLLHLNTEGFHILLYTLHYTAHSVCEQLTTYALDFLHKNESQMQIQQCKKYMYVTYRVDARVGINLQSVNIIT